MTPSCLCSHHVVRQQRIRKGAHVPTFWDTMFQKFHRVPALPNVDRIPREYVCQQRNTATPNSPNREKHDTNLLPLRSPCEDRCPDTQFSFTRKIWVPDVVFACWFCQRKSAFKVCSNCDLEHCDIAVTPPGPVWFNINTHPFPLCFPLLQRKAHHHRNLFATASRKQERETTQLNHAQTRTTHIHRTTTLRNTHEHQTRVTNSQKQLDCVE